MNWFKMDLRIYIFTLIKLLDGITTHMGLNMGYIEVNPFVNYVIINIGSGLYIIISTLICFILLMILKQTGITFKGLKVKHSDYIVNTTIDFLIIIVFVLVLNNSYYIYEGIYLKC